MKTTSCIRKTLLSSCTLLIASVLALGSTVEPADAGLWDNIKGRVKSWHTAYRLGEFDGDNIPETSVEYVGSIDLILREQVELAFGEDVPGIGNVGWMGVSPEGTLLLTDVIGRQAHEFSRTDGQYIRSFGQQGNGPGEYDIPENMAIDPQGRLYILDTAFGRLFRYDRQGRYSTNGASGLQAEFRHRQLDKSVFVRLQPMPPH